VAKTPALDAPRLEWARGLFAEYYRSVSLDPPPRFTRREFAAFPFSAQTLMRRHAALRTTDEFVRFLRDEIPRHVYYSSAYYRNPAHATMAQKEWLGADLIFDLDADHLRQAAGKSYSEQLALAKARFRDLVDEFLLGDFGIDPKDLTLVFSGGRGYHAHVHADAFLRLSTTDRREIVEYILGIGLDVREAILEVREGDRAAVSLVGGGRGSGAGAVSGSGSHRQKPFRRLYPPDSPGWPGRISRAFAAILARWEAGGESVAARELREAGVGEATARKWADLLVRQRKGERIRETRTLDVFPGEFPPPLLDAILHQAAIEVQGETDAPVTTDIHRLIRLPGSLHGGTGLRVVPLTRDELDAFEPLRDARIPGEDGTVVLVRLAEDVDYPWVPEPVRGRRDDVREVSRSAALFLTLRGEAIPTALESPRASSPA
jgi:DNA primase small subunit